MGEILIAFIVFNPTEIWKKTLTLLILSFLSIYRLYIPLLGDSELCLQPEDHSLTPWLHTEVLWAWLSPLCTFLALQILVRGPNLKHEPQRLKNDIKKQSYDLALLKNL